MVPSEAHCHPSFHCLLFRVQQEEVEKEKQLTTIRWSSLTLLSSNQYVTPITPFERLLKAFLLEDFWNSTIRTE